MSDKRKVDLLTYGITFGACVAFVIWHLVSNKVLELATLDQLRILCDAFSLPGMLCLLGGLMVWASNNGSFIAVGFILTYAFRALIPGTGKPENFTQYRERMLEKPDIPYGFLFVVGGVFFGISLIFLVLFHMHRT